LGLGVLLLLALLLFAVLAGFGAPTSEGSAVVEEVQGQAFACPRTTGCADPAAPGVRVFVGGEARTGASSFQDLQTGTATFRLQENATIRFRQVTDAATFLLVQSGRVFANHDPGGQIIVQAGDVRVEAVDTRFCVVVTGGNTYVAVPSPTGGKGRNPGSVQITADGAVRKVTAGQEITLGPGATNRVQRISPAQQRLWDQLANWP
jgi:hypothetical protein